MVPNCQSRNGDQIRSSYCTNYTGRQHPSSKRTSRPRFGDSKRSRGTRRIAHSLYHNDFWTSEAELPHNWLDITYCCTLHGITLGNNMR